MRFSFSFGEVLLSGQKYPKPLQSQNAKSVSRRCFRKHGIVWIFLSSMVPIFDSVLEGARILQQHMPLSLRIVAHALILVEIQILNPIGVTCL